jgi:hypothetical protein
VAGFVLKQQQLPSSAGTLVLRTLQVPESANLQQTPKSAATAAACMRNAECVMVTSDGFLIGAYKTADTVKSWNRAIAFEQQGGGPLLWVPMQYCAGRCCGTWVAEGLEQQLLTPAKDSSALQEVQERDNSVDKSASEHYRFNADVMKRFCAQTETSSATPTALPAQQCPRRCQVACCAEFSKGKKRFNSDNDFMQCASDPCAHGCTLPGNRTAVLGLEEGVFGAASSPAQSVLKRQYLRAASATAVHRFQTPAWAEAQVVLQLCRGH